MYIITGANGHLAKAIIIQLRDEDVHMRGLILPGDSGTDDLQITYYQGDVTVVESMDG